MEDSQWQALQRKRRHGAHRSSPSSPTRYATDSISLSLSGSLVALYLFPVLSSDFLRYGGLCWDCGVGLGPRRGGDCRCAVDAGEGFQFRGSFTLVVRRILRVGKFL